MKAAGANAHVRLLVGPVRCHAGRPRRRAYRHGSGSRVSGHASTSTLSTSTLLVVSAGVVVEPKRWHLVGASGALRLLPGGEDRSALRPAAAGATKPAVPGGAGLAAARPAQPARWPTCTKFIAVRRSWSQTASTLKFGRRRRTSRYRSL